MIETDIAVGSGMKVRCTRDELAQRLATVARAVSTRSSVQVLLGVLLRAEGDQLHLEVKLSPENWARFERL